ncbi:hypothetical protein GGQ84_003060 [Desulfitispora alkaliphila]
MLFKKRRRLNILSIMAYPVAFIKGIILGRMLGKRL